MACSVHKISSGKSSEKYYTQLAQDDYYTHGGEPPGRWLGSGATTLSLESWISSGDERMTALMQGCHPHYPGQVLRQGATVTRTYADGHVAKPTAAYDLTFSAPKSVSVLYALADSKLREHIRSSQQAAVDEVAAHIETHLCRTRTGRGGQQQEKLLPIFAAFDHTTSRALDPQLHTHLLLMNTGLRRNGRGGALDGRLLLQKDTILALGQCYRDTLKLELERRCHLKTLHREIPGGTSFEIDGVPQALCQQFSKRSAQIEALASPNDSPRQRKQKVLQTRSAKTKDISHRQLLKGWRTEAQTFGHEPSRIVAQALNQARDKPTRRNRNDARSPPRTAASIKGASNSSGERQPSRGRFDSPYDAQYWQEIGKARKLEAKTRSLRERKQLYLYLSGRINRQQYQESRTPEAYPKSQLQINTAYAFHRISKQQRDVLMSIHGHAPFAKVEPKTIVGTHFAYLTRRITKAHYIRLRAEQKAVERYRQRSQAPELKPEKKKQPFEKTPYQSKQMPQQPKHQNQTVITKEREQERER